VDNVTTTSQAHKAPKELLPVFYPQAAVESQMLCKVDTKEAIRRYGNYWITASQLACQ
jgi:hypothetical protein